MKTVNGVILGAIGLALLAAETVQAGDNPWRASTWGTQKTAPEPQPVPPVQEAPVTVVPLPMGTYAPVDLEERLENPNYAPPVPASRRVTREAPQPVPPATTGQWDRVDPYGTGGVPYNYNYYGPYSAGGILPGSLYGTYYGTGLTTPYAGTGLTTPYGGTGLGTLWPGGVPGIGLPLYGGW